MTLPSKGGKMAREPWEEEMAIETRMNLIALAMWLPLAIAVFVLYASFRHRNFTGLLLVVNCALLAAPYLARRLLRKNDERFIYGEPADELTRRADEFSRAMDMPGKQVYAYGSPEGKIYVCRASSPDRVTVSRAALAKLRQGELEFLLARALVPQPAFTGSPLFLSPALVVMGAVLLLLALTNPPYPNWLGPALLILFVAAAVATLWLSSHFLKKEMFATDLKALAATGDLDSAANCISRLGDTPGYAGPNQMVIGSVAPEARIARLREEWARKDNGRTKE